MILQRNTCKSVMLLVTMSECKALNSQRVLFLRFPSSSHFMASVTTAMLVYDQFVYIAYWLLNHSRDLLHPSTLSSESLFSSSNVTVI